MIWQKLQQKLSHYNHVLCYGTVIKCESSAHWTHDVEHANRVQASLKTILFAKLNHFKIITPYYYISTVFTHVFLISYDFILFLAIFSHFGYYDEEGLVIPFFLRKIYRNDDIGLKTLHREGRLKVITFPNVRHFDWHLNATVIQESILPHLDWFSATINISNMKKWRSSEY